MHKTVDNFFGPSLIFNYIRNTENNVVNPKSKNHFLFYLLVLME